MAAVPGMIESAMKVASPIAHWRDTLASERLALRNAFFAPTRRGCCAGSRA